MSKLAAIILAAGKGVRMESDLPKVFHPINGQPMLTYVLKAVQTLRPDNLLVVAGYQRQLLIDHYRDWPVQFVIQEEQLGTGHAVRQAEKALAGFEGEVLVLAGDVPLIRPETLAGLLAFHRQQKAAATDLTAELPEAGNYGRVVRDQQGRLLKIVEKKDASPEELRIREINTGTFCFDKKELFAALAELKADNAQREYYLTDTIEIMRRKNLPVCAWTAADYRETLGANTRAELAELAAHVPVS
jgi:UDP-N-acetylglucosamine diphosphorylase/glucosamine-1-phosphate N-acetyltransferase